MTITTLPATLSGGLPAVLSYNGIEFRAVENQTLKYTEASSVEHVDALATRYEAFKIIDAINEGCYEPEDMPTWNEIDHENYWCNCSLILNDGYGYDLECCVVDDEGNDVWAHLNLKSLQILTGSRVAAEIWDESGDVSGLYWF